MSDTERISRRINARVGENIVADDGTEGEIIKVQTDRNLWADRYGVEDIDLAIVEWPQVGRRLVDAHDIEVYYEVAA